MKSMFNACAVLLLLTLVTRTGATTNVAFQVGERLTYQVYWGPFIAGRAVLEVAGVEKVDGHDCYHLVARAKTSGLADLMFHVESTSESWLDMEGLFTRRYRQNRVEGSHFKIDETTFDYVNKTAATRNLRNGKVRRQPLESPVQDVVSSLYYVRLQELHLDTEKNFMLIASGTNYLVRIAPDQRKTLWVRPVGDVPALRIEPSPTMRIVAANKGRMWFWVSDDRRRLPLILASDTKIGSAKFVLSKIEKIKPPSALASSATPATITIATDH
jgi:hypothetical protein